MLFGASWNHFWASGWRGPVWCHPEPHETTFGVRAGGGQIGAIRSLLEPLLGFGLAGVAVVVNGVVGSVGIGVVVIGDADVTVVF